MLVPESLLAARVIMEAYMACQIAAPAQACSLAILLFWRLFPWDLSILLRHSWIRSSNSSLLCIGFVTHHTSVARETVISVIPEVPLLLSKRDETVRPVLPLA